jgi:hypothetical protein
MSSERVCLCAMTLQMAKKDRKDTEEKKEIAVARLALPITWNTEGTQTLHANNMIVQADEHDFYLSFFEAVPPILLGSSADDRIKEAGSLKGVEAKCVARIVVNGERMGLFLNAIQGAINKHIAVRESKKGADGKDGST